MLQDPVWAGVTEKSGQGLCRALSKAGLLVSVECRWLSPGPRAGCGARKKRGSGNVESKAFIFCDTNT